MVLEAPPKENAPLEPTRRLFFALWPDEPMRQALTQATRKAVRASGGRPVAEGNLHVTLAFLGSIPERRLPDLAAAARAAALKHAPRGANAPEGSSGPAGEHAQAPADRLELAFDRLEQWRAAHLLCALSGDPPAPVADLARRLQDQLAGAGFAPDSKPFRPHVTVARKVHHPPRMAGIDPVIWSFADFVLVDSKTLPAGSAYTVLERFPLVY